MIGKPDTAALNFSSISKSKTCFRLRLCVGHCRKLIFQASLALMLSNKPKRSAEIQDSMSK